MVQSKYWTWVLNNPTEEDFKLVDKLGRDKRVHYQICNYEMSDSETPHLQGYTVLHNKLRDTTIWKLLPRAHFEKRKKNATHAQNVHYCSKPHDDCECQHCYKIIHKEEGYRISGPYVWGDDKDIPQHETEQGKRSDLEQIIKRIDEGALLSDLRREFPSQYVRCKKFMIEEIEERRQRLFYEKQKKEFEKEDTEDWQDRIVIELAEQNRREIMFLVDREGNGNKSKFGKLLRSIYDFQYFKVGKKLDFSHTFRKHISDYKQKIVIDIPRGKQEYVEYIYSTLEDLKDGELEAGKFDSDHLSFDYSKILVLMNNIPSIKQLSKDRPVVYELKDNKITKLDNERLIKGLIN